MCSEDMSVKGPCNVAFCCSMGYYYITNTFMLWSSGKKYDKSTIEGHRSYSCAIFVNEYTKIRSMI